MARMEPIQDDKFPEDAKAILEEVKKAFGMIPNLFMMYMAYPSLLRANWEKFKTVMVGGRLKRKVRETIALLVSTDNGCKYCIVAHSKALKTLGVSEEELQAINKDIDHADFSEKEKAIIRFARKANKDPLSITDAEFDTVRQTSASDAEIIQALGIMELFAGFNKFLDSLKVDIDF